MILPNQSLCVTTDLSEKRRHSKVIRYPIIQLPNYCFLQFSKQFQHQQPMEAAQPQPQSDLQPEITALKLYVFGSCQSDQYYHPKQENQSKRPICLTDLERFTIAEENEEGEEKETIFDNPLFGVKINKITCGALHTVIASVEGKVYTFGCNDEGALGRDGVEKIPLEVKLEHAVDLISAGDNHSVFASSGAGIVYFTGNYKFLRGEKMVDPIKTPIQFDINQINNRQNPESKLTKVVSGSNHSAILIGGKIFIRGEPEAHTVGRRINERNKLKSSLTFEGVGLNNVEDLWCGGYHTVAKVKKGNSWAYFGWGLNKHGQLGINNYEESPYPIEIKKLRKKDIIDVAAGTNFTVFLTEAGELFGCGQNDDGQLGLGEDYQYVDSEEEEERQLEAEIKEKMNLDDGQKEAEPEKIEAEVHGENPEVKGEAEPKNEEKPAEKVEEKAEQKPAESHGLKENNIYIKSIKPIPIDNKLNHITAGSEFVYGWNNDDLYSWGFGMNYVLLNGNQQDECQPFKVKPAILNNHRIHQLSAGAQHVAYLSYPKEGRLAKIELSEAARKIAMESRKKLSRRKRSPAAK